MGQLKADIATIVRIGWPLIINNVSSIGVNVADTLMASTLGATQLAAIALGSGIWISVFLLGLGTIMALGPTIAQHFGGGRHAEIGHDTRQGFWLALFITLPVIVIMRTAEPWLLKLGIDGSVSSLAQAYLDALSWGVLGAYFYHTLKQLSEGVGRTIPIMVVMGIALPINIGLNYAFMFGRLGAPALGAEGAGVGNAIALWVMFAMITAYTVRAPHYRTFEIWRAIELPDFRAIGRLVVLGLPIGMSLFLQSGLFTSVALIMAALGTVAVAAHQIALNYSGLVFMVPLGLGMALTVCVGQAVGRGDPVSARRIGYTGVWLCTCLSSVSAITTWLFARELAELYSTDPQIIGLSTELFRIAAFLQFGDGLQVAAAFALRGMKDTRIPLILNALNYWGVGFTLAYALGVTLSYGPRGIWIGLALALCSAGCLLLARFTFLSGRLIKQQSAIKLTPVNGA